MDRWVVVSEGDTSKQGAARAGQGMELRKTGRKTHRKRDGRCREGHGSRTENGAPRARSSMDSAGHSKFLLPDVERCCDPKMRSKRHGAWRWRAQSESGSASSQAEEASSSAPCWAAKPR